MVSWVVVFQCIFQGCCCNFIAIKLKNELLLRRNLVTLVLFFCIILLSIWIYYFSGLLRPWAQIIIESWVSNHHLLLWTFKYRQLFISLFKYFLLFFQRHNRSFRLSMIHLFDTVCVIFRGLLIEIFQEFIRFYFNLRLIFSIYFYILIYKRRWSCYNDWWKL